MAADISVIVPVYNVEEYLAPCLDSILGQSHENLEVIVVNDGSTDGSPAIMQDYAARDARVKVADKPNGGYGSAVNRGLDEAQGEYVAIVEPDDFIDPFMYEDLLAASYLDDGRRADVVKSAYWNYYDADTDYEGQAPYIQSTNLGSCMPKERHVFNVFERSEVLKHHPSVWSAIYKRSFIKDKNIRMMEPKGAGWVDNPFLYETLCQANEIVWLPTAYYYYRQTNPNASSHIKDYNLPFDRLRDIRAIMKRLDIKDPKVLGTVYNRSFSYIRTVYETFGFPETDPELQKLVREVMDSFDKDVMRSAAGPWTPFGQYYRDINGSFIADIKAHPASSNPQLSIIVSLEHKRPYLYDLFASLIAQNEPDFEVICVVSGDKDRTAEVTEGVASKDRRFKFVRTQPGENPYLLGVELAQAPLITFIDPRTRFDSGYVREIVSRKEQLLACGMGILANSISLYVQGDARDISQVEVKAVGNIADLAHSLRGRIYGLVLTRDFVANHRIAFPVHESGQAPETVVSALSQAAKVLVIRTEAVTDQSYLPLNATHNLIDDETICQKYGFDEFGQLRDYAEASGSEEVLQAYRTILLMKVWKDLDECQNVLTLKEYLEFLEESGFLDSLELDKHSPVYYGDPLAYREVQKVLQSGYDNYILKNYERIKRRNIVLKDRVTNANAKIDKVKRLFATGPGKLAKKVMPDSLWRKIGGSF